MITEIAQIDVKPGMEQEFEAGVAKAAPVFKRAKGCHGVALEKSIEKPSRYRLFVQWETVENHTVDFRGSADFQVAAPASGIASRARRWSSTPRRCSRLEVPLTQQFKRPSGRSRGRHRQHQGGCKTRI